MKEFKCHKVVMAGLIISITLDAEEIIIYTECGSTYIVDNDFIKKHAIDVGKSYLVEYENNYLSVSPKDVFEAGYSEMKYANSIDEAMTEACKELHKELITNTEGCNHLGNLDFGCAIDAMKSGYRVARSGWNGNGMFAYYVEGGAYPSQMKAIEGIFEGNVIPYRPYLALKTAQDDVATWVPSVSDILATDWCIVE